MPTSHVVRSIVQCAVVAGIASCSTGESEDQLGDIRYEIAVNCSTPVCIPPGPLAKGTSAGILIILQDSTPDSTALPQVRAMCATNVELRRVGGVGGVLRTFPATPTCTDSIIPGGENWPALIGVARVFVWDIPADMPSGSYVLTAKILAEPRVDRSITVIIE